jgi:hypothetical protein
MLHHRGLWLVAHLTPKTSSSYALCMNDIEDVMTSV